MDNKFLVRVQSAAFDSSAEVKLLSNDSKCGAIVSFVGLVRDYGDRQNIVALELEHYPGMTEQALQQIIAQAKQRWKISGAIIIHRIGRLALGEPIVLVVTASAHRSDAFAACEFLMDYLKTKAPFWKKEIMQNGESIWVEAKSSDNLSAERWNN